MAEKKMIKVTQVGSIAKATDVQKCNVRGLGLRRMNQSRILEDTPSVRGMITKVSHLVKFEEVSE